MSTSNQKQIYTFSIKIANVSQGYLDAEREISIFDKELD
jgi:hypothetical protein